MAEQSLARGRSCLLQAINTGTLPPHTAGSSKRSYTSSATLRTSLGKLSLSMTTMTALPMERRHTPLSLMLLAWHVRLYRSESLYLLNSLCLTLSSPGTSTTATAPCHTPHSHITSHTSHSHKYDATLLVDVYSALFSFIDTWVSRYCP